MNTILGALLCALTTFLISRFGRMHVISPMRDDMIALEPPSSNYTRVDDTVMTHNDQNTTVLEERWYSIKTNQGIGAAILRSRHAPWPVSRSCGVPTVRYCFDSETSRAALETVVAYAITRWMPAMQHSTLKITPDNACINPRLQQWNWGCICGVQTYNYNRRTSSDALVIKAGRSDSNGNPTAPTV